MTASLALWAAVAAVVLLVPMLGVAVVNALTAPRLDGAPPPREIPLVSVLVPARNEAANLARALPALLASDYPSFEIHVLDDESTDATVQVVEEHVAKDSGGRLALHRGQPLPAGWVGKNWACHQLAHRARGEVLVFCDADVTAEPAAIRRTVGLLQAHAAGAASALPRLRTPGWMQAAVVPLITQLPVLALLPLWLVPRTGRPSIAMANGQWLAFARPTYDAIGGHAAVRAEVLEDVRLARLVKRSGHRLVAALAPRCLSVRMYDDVRSLREGFAKNVYALLGGSPAALVAGFGVWLSAMVAPWALLAVSWRAALVPLALLVLVRAIAAASMRHDWRGLVAHPLGALAAAGIALESAYRTWRGVAHWRGRRLGSDASSGAAYGERRPGAGPHRDTVEAGCSEDTA
jgi:chlorobactene glucosyltransferase